MEKKNGKSTISLSDEHSQSLYERLDYHVSKRKYYLLANYY